MHDVDQTNKSHPLPQPLFPYHPNAYRKIKFNVIIPILTGP